MIMITSQIFAGTIYYVDATNGSDYNPGTEIYPWKTIQKAANTMIAGDKVIVRTGTYDERITGNTSGNRGSLITFQVNSGDIVNCYGFTLTGDYIKNAATRSGVVFYKKINNKIKRNKNVL